MPAIPLLTPDDPIALDPDTASHWLRSDGRAFPLSRATQAFLLILETMRVAGKPAPRVWIPDYFCEGALFHLRDRHIPLSFYPITEDMQPDWEKCARLAADTPPDLFVLPHYFGVANAVSAARHFCTTHNALLMEDAVHFLRPVGPAGRLGDFVVYSPRKYLSIPDGGLLVVRGDSLVASALQAARALPQERSSTLAWSVAALRPRVRIDSGPMRPITMAYEFPQQVPPRSVWMSRLAKARIGKSLRDGSFDRVEKRETEARRQIESALTGWQGLVPLNTEPGAVPYMFAMRGTDGLAVAQALQRLREAGAMAAPWPTLPPEVQANPGAHEAARHVRSTLLRFYPRQSGRRRPLDFLSRLSLPPGQRDAPRDIDQIVG